MVLENLLQTADTDDLRNQGKDIPLRPVFPFSL